MKNSIKTVAIYCGAQKGNEPIYEQAAILLAKLLLRRNWNIVYGGGSIGIMGIIADTFLKGGGKITGVITEKLMDFEVGHKGLTEMLVTKSMAERKQKMIEMADAFIALPGGVGTLEEIIEAFVLTQLGYHKKPCGFYNVNGYYDHLSLWLDHSTGKGFIRKHMREMLLFENDPELLIHHLEHHKISTIEEFYIEKKDD